MNSHFEGLAPRAFASLAWGMTHGYPSIDDAAEQSTTAQLLSSYCQVVRDLDGKPEAFLRDAGIDPAEIHQPGGKVALRVVAQLLEHTADRLSCPDMGLRLAEHQSGPSLMQPLERLLSNAPTVGDSLRCCIDYVDVFNSGLVINLERDPESSLYFLSLEFPASAAPFPQLTEQLLLLIHRYANAMSGGVARARMVSLSHTSGASRPAYAKRFHAPVKFGQPFDGIFFTEADIRAKVVNSNPAVFAAEYRRVAARFTARPSTMDQKVRQVICRALAESNCSRQHVAALLGLPERTLNRRLQQLGTTFEGLRDEVRRNLAYRYLARGDLPLTEICARLNYSEMAVLSRSCQRWFGAPPNEVRRYLRQQTRGTVTS